MSVMSKSNLLNNGVNEARASSKSLSPCKCPMGDQSTPGRHPTTAVRTRRKWSQQDNKSVIECFYRSNPKKAGYGKRMYALWIEMGMFNVTEQRQMDQKNQILKKQWLTEIELEEIERAVDDVKLHGKIRVRVVY